VSLRRKRGRPLATRCASAMLCCARVNSSHACQHVDETQEQPGTIQRDARDRALRHALREDKPPAARLSNMRSHRLDSGVGQTQAMRVAVHRSVRHDGRWPPWRPGCAESLNVTSGAVARQVQLAPVVKLVGTMLCTWGWGRLSTALSTSAPRARPWPGQARPVCTVRPWAT
jgi:hypothetical protein